MVLTILHLYGPHINTSTSATLQNLRIKLKMPGQPSNKTSIFMFIITIESEMRVILTQF